MTFDTFTYAEGLKNSGIPEEHVKALTQELTKALKSEDLATKQDIENLATATKQDIKDLAVSTKIEMAELSKEIEKTKTDMIKWVAGILVAQAGLIIAAIKLF